ncbi:restriction endonuclease subunit S [Vallitalea sediminicola]
MREISNTPLNWSFVKIDDVCERKSGHTPDKKIDEYWGGSIPWISLKDLNKLDKLYISNTVDYTTDEGINNSSAVLLPEGTVVVSRDANVGKVAITTLPMATSQHFINYICGEKYNNIFLYYLLLSKRNLFKRIAVGSTIVTIGVGFFKELKVLQPPLAEQKKIAKILSTVDNHIDEVDGMIEDLKELKKGLMQKLLTEGIGHKEFKDSPVGKIPVEWKVKKLREIVKICYGKDQKKVIDYNGKYSIFGTGGVIGRTNSWLHDKPSVLIGRKGTIDKPRYIDEPFWTVDTLFYTIVKDDYLAKWLYYAISNVDLNRYNEATGVPSLSIGNLNNIKFSVPTMEEQIAIVRVIDSFEERIEIQENKHEDLKKVKKGLMQKLLTGELRVEVNE